MTPPALPPFPDLPTARSYLSQLPLTNPAQALPALTSYYHRLLTHPLPARTYVKALEAAQPALSMILAEHAKRFLGKAVPLAELEEKAFQETVATWALVARTYANCAQNDRESDPEHLQRAGLCFHRSTHYASQTLHEHYRARRELSPWLWLTLYRYYRSAEQWRVADIPVREPLPDSESNHAAGALITALLTELAGPYSFSVRDMDCIRRWAARWSAMVSIHRTSVGDALPEYVIDLVEDQGLRLSEGVVANDDLRLIDTQRLGIELAQTQLALKQRTPPAQLGLGSDISRGRCLTLLSGLVRPWTQATAPRRFKRRAANGHAKLAVGFEAIHALVSGKEFVQPESARTYSRQEFETLYAFRHMADPTAKLQFQARAPEFPVDEWDVLNQSATGFRLERGPVGQRVAHGQLITINPPDGDRYLLAQAHWLMQEQNGGLVAGIGMLPGSPTAIAARLTGINVSRSEPFSRAFMLPELPAISAPASLVLPSGWYQPGRIIELFDEVSWRARLESILERGSNFERVAFSIVG
jgi:hypothetical protein